MCEFIFSNIRENLSLTEACEFYIECTWHLNAFHHNFQATRLWQPFRSAFIARHAMHTNGDAAKKTDTQTICIASWIVDHLNSFDKIVINWKKNAMNHDICFNWVGVCEWHATHKTDTNSQDTRNQIQCTTKFSVHLRRKKMISTVKQNEKRKKIFHSVLEFVYCIHRFTNVVNVAVCDTNHTISGNVFKCVAWIEKTKPTQYRVCKLSSGRLLTLLFQFVLFVSTFLKWQILQNIQENCLTSSLSSTNK